MTTTETHHRFSLIEGERYRFNFPRSPGGAGTYLGRMTDGWIAMEVYDRDSDSERVTFYNLANLNALTPESDPRL